MNENNWFGKLASRVDVEKSYPEKLAHKELDTSTQHPIIIYKYRVCISQLKLLSQKTTTHVKNIPYRVYISLLLLYHKILY